MECKKVITAEERNQLAFIADEIWHEYFVCILTNEQIDYMVEKFQSVHAITNQIQNQGYEYYLLVQDGTDIGYIGIRPEDDALFLSKLYIKKDFRGNGYASKAFDFLVNICWDRKLNHIWLTVNRFNEHTITVYQKKGFAIIRSQVTDIGNGFVMDDYVMQKTIQA